MSWTAHRAHHGSLASSWTSYATSHSEPDDYPWPRRRSSIMVPHHRSIHPVVVEERRPRRRSSHIVLPIHLRRLSSARPIILPERLRRRSSTRPIILAHHLRRRSSAQPIVLPPLPSKSRRKSTAAKHLYFTRPHDGRPHHRHGTFGRLKDVLSGTGPDVFVTATSSKSRLMRDRPQTWQWSGHGLSEREILTKIVEPGFAWNELEPVRDAPWVGRAERNEYDFRRRRYTRVTKEDGVWTDARWSPEARKGSWPEKYRDGRFE